MGIFDYNNSAMFTGGGQADVGAPVTGPVGPTPTGFGNNTPCAPGLVLKNGQCVPPGASGATGNVQHAPYTGIPEEQWTAWEKYKDSACPPERPYKSSRGAQGCFEKPVDCPDGQMPGGPSTEQPCVPNQGGGSGGAGSAGKGGGGGAGAAVPPGIADFGINGRIAEEIQKILNGETTTFNPKAVASITGQNKLNEQSTIARQTQMLRENQAAHGVTGSPFAAAQEGRIATQAGQTFDQSQANLQVEVAKQNFTDKMQGLGAAQSWLNSLRNYALGMDSNSVAREGILANVQLGEDKIKSELQMQLTGIAGQKDLLGLQLDSNESLQLQKLLLCVQTGVC